MVLSDNLVYYQDEETYETGGAPKGKVRLIPFHHRGRHIHRARLSLSLLSTASLLVVVSQVSLNAIYCPTPPETEDFEFTLYALPFEFTVRSHTKSDMEDWIRIFQNIQSI